MNKKLNTLLFIVAGTVLNVILMIVLILGLLFISTAILRGIGYEPNQSIYKIVGGISAIAGMVLSFVAYSKITKLLQNKYNFEQYLEPIFRQKR